MLDCYEFTACGSLRYFNKSFQTTTWINILRVEYTVLPKVCDIFHARKVFRLYALMVRFPNFLHINYVKREKKNKSSTFMPLEKNIISTRNFFV